MLGAILAASPGNKHDRAGVYPIIRLQEVDLMLTRTRIGFVGLSVMLAAFAIGCSSAMDGGEDGAALAKPGAPAVEEPIEQDRYDSAGEPIIAGGSAGKAPDAAGSAGPPGDPLAPDAALQGLIDRKIVQSASVDLEVEEVARAFQDIVRLAQTAGGFVGSSSFSHLDEQQIADLTIRVPAGEYQGVLARIRDMGEVAQEGSEAQDATEEYTDLGARLRTLQATEQRYLELLARAETINDILVVQDRLDGVRAQIEQVQGRINLLDSLTELATITVHIRPLVAAVDTSGDSGPHPIRAAEQAWQRSLDTLAGLATAGLVVAAFSWWLVPPAIAIAAAARWRGRRPKESSSSA